MVNYTNRIQWVVQNGRVSKAYLASKVIISSIFGLNRRLFAKIMSLTSARRRRVSLGNGDSRTVSLCLHFGLFSFFAVLWKNGQIVFRVSEDFFEVCLALSIEVLEVEVPIKMFVSAMVYALSCRKVDARPVPWPTKSSIFHCLEEHLPVNWYLIPYIRYLME